MTVICALCSHVFTDEEETEAIACGVLTIPIECPNCNEFFIDFKKD